MAYDAMQATHPAAFLWFVGIIVMGNYILLNLFLAILLENFGSSANGGASTANSTGGTLAAAAKAAQLMAWLQDIVEGSWFAKVFKRRNRVSAMEDDELGDAVVAPSLASGSKQQSQSSKFKAAVAFQGPSENGGSSSSADGTRSPALLLGDAGSGDGSLKMLSASGQRASVAEGYPTAAARRRSVRNCYATELDIWCPACPCSVQCCVSEVSYALPATTYQSLHMLQRLY